MPRSITVPPNAWLLTSRFTAPLSTSPLQLRDPIYASTYDSVEKAIQNGQPIAGSLFWKWAIPVFDKQDPRGELTRCLCVMPSWRKSVCWC